MGLDGCLTRSWGSWHGFAYAPFKHRLRLVRVRIRAAVEAHVPALEADLDISRQALRQSCAGRLSNDHDGSHSAVPCRDQGCPHPGTHRARRLLFVLQHGEFVPEHVHGRMHHDGIVVVPVECRLAALDLHKHFKIRCHCAEAMVNVQQ